MDIRDALKATALSKDTHNARNAELWNLLFGEDIEEKRDFLQDTESRFSHIVAEDKVSAAHQRLALLPENPNPKATIAFIMEHPFYYSVHKNVYRHLKAGAEFVIDASMIRKNVKEWFPLLKNVARFLKSENVYFRFYSPAVNDKRPAEEFFSQYTTLVSHTHLHSVLREECNAHKKKIRVMYGQSKDIYDFGPGLSIFDLALTYGSYSHELTSNFTKSIVVGNPKFDDWFQNAIPDDCPGALLLRKRLDPKKKTVLYLPTHGDLASIEWIEPALSGLVKDYNFVIRPHQLTIQTEKKRKSLLRLYSQRGAIIANDFFDLLSLFKVADVVLLDNSGAIFDSVLAEKRIVLIDFLSSDFLQTGQWQAARKRNANSWTTPLTNKDSIEQRIKRETDICPGPIVKDTNSLREAIELSLKGEDAYAAPQRKLREMLFSHNDGRAGERAAAHIKNIASEQERREPTFLAASYSAESARRQAYNQSSINLLYDAFDMYVNPLPLKEKMFPSILMPVFSVVIPTFNRKDRLACCLEALRLQEAKRCSFEIIVIDDASTDGTEELVKSFIARNDQQLMIRYIRLHSNSGPAVARNVGIVAARGEFVCFTDDDSVVPKNWLKVFKDVFRNNREIAGAGGWRIPFKDDNSIFAQFKFREDLYRHQLRRGQKSGNFFGTPAGDTASMCYRKSVLKAAGGFNPNFKLVRSPALEDWELKTRLHNARYSLLYTPRLLVRHHHSASFGEFARRCYVSGWGFFLLMRIYPQTHQNTYDFMMRPVLALASEWRWISVARVSFFRKITFLSLAVIKILIFKAAKYIAVIMLLDRFPGPTNISSPGRDSCYKD